MTILIAIGAIVLGFAALWLIGAWMTVSEENRK